MYDTIWKSLLYDINLWATATTILSIEGVTIPIGLVNSATDSIRQHVVLFKLVPVPASDPKSEFLCQSSLRCAEPADPLNPPRTPGISPTPSSSHITLIATVPVLWQSTWSRSSIIRELNVLVAASLLKSSRTFHLNVTVSSTIKQWFLLWQEIPLWTWVEVDTVSQWRSSYHHTNYKICQ